MRWIILVLFVEPLNVVISFGGMKCSQDAGLPMLGVLAHLAHLASGDHGSCHSPQFSILAPFPAQRPLFLMVGAYTSPMATFSPYGALASDSPPSSSIAVLWVQKASDWWSRISGTVERGNLVQGDKMAVGCGAIFSHSSHPCQVSP